MKAEQTVAAVLLATALLLLGMVFLTPAFIRPDSVAVYAYLHSAVFDRDLLFFDEWNSFGLIRDGVTLFKEVTPLGTLANHWWIGTSIASAPFHLVATTMGRSPGWSLAWSSVLFTFVTLAIAERLAPRRWLALASVLFGTPLFWYTFRLPLGTHAAGAMFVAAAAYAALRDRDFPAGLLLGLAIATRLQHFVLIPAFVVLAIRRRRPWQSNLRAATGVAIGVLPQLIAWYAIYGSPLGPLTSGANLAGTTWLPFRSIALGAVLYSSYHGLFVWSPVVALAIIGWFEGLREQRDAAILFLLMFAGEWIANGTFDRYFWGGLSFGPRRFVDLAAPFAVGIAWFCRSRVRAILVIAATLWSCALAAEALTGTLSLSRYVSFADLLPLLSFGRVQLHSSIGASFAESIVALLIVAGVAAIFILLRRYTVPIATAYLLFVSIFLAAITPATRARAAGEITRFAIRRRAAEHLGPLLDERRLLSDEVDYLRATGHDPRPTEREIAAIDRVVAQLQR